MDQLIDFVLHLSEHLKSFAEQNGPWVYGLLFLIVFAETGLVITPFLPGDSLLFATGALAANGTLDIRIVFPLLAMAAIGGDAVNYAVGHFVGPRIFKAEDRASFWHRLLNRNHLMKAHAFFERHGGKAIVLGRFVPIVRTFVPFVAGCGAMSYPKFFIYNVGGGLLWVGLCIGAGYAFGNIPKVQDHFEFVLIGIVAISMLPIVWGYLINKLSRDTPQPVKAKADAHVE
jgi:membrane-associated protein